MSQLITVIPVYNGEKYLDATLESLAQQTLRPDRVIVQDNCSTDGTQAVVERFRQRHPDLNCEWRQNERDIGSGGNFNRALGFAAEADYLHLIPHDDLIRPHFYERLLAALGAIGGPTFAYSAYEVIGEDGQSVPGGDLNCPFPVLFPSEVRELDLRRFLEWQADLKTICLPAVLMKTGRKSLPVEFSFDYIQAADAVFYAELAARGFRVFEVTEALCQYRRHIESYTTSNQRRPGSVIADEWKAMQAIGRLIPQSRMARWLWRQRQQCLLAARSAVKSQLIGDAALAKDVRRVATECVGPLHCWLGYFAVALRDCIRKVRSRNRQ